MIRFQKTPFIVLPLCASLVLVSLVSAALLLSQGGTPALAQDTAEAAHQLYLPLVQEGQPETPPTAPPPTTPPPTTPPPTAVPATPQPLELDALFADTEWRTNSASIATDGADNIHLGFTYYHGLAEDAPTNGVYVTCEANCADGASWQGVLMGEGVDEIQIALTPQGQPRVLYRIASASNGWNYFYAACESNCALPARWTVTYITSSEGMAPVELSDDELPQRYFALDPMGRPRFVYGDRAPRHLGTFYAFCDADCTDRANWYEVRINEDNGNSGPYRDEDFYYPALTFTPAGQPRVVVDGVSMEDEFYLFYVACDRSCDQANNWSSVPLFDRGSGYEVSYDVAVDAQGRPRIAFFEGAQLGGGGNRLWYAWCNGDCTQPANWQRSEMGLPTSEGQEPDLELDGAGRPHVAYALYSEGGLGYSICQGNCESGSANWQHEVLESRNDLQMAWPVAMPSHCDGGLWDGLTPSLALGSDDAPHIAYDITYYARCHYVGEDQWEPWSEMNLVWRAVRVLFPTGS